MVFAEFGTGQVFWSILWFTLFFMWIWLVITIFSDIFRSPDLSGGGKALWSIFVIFMPYLGVFVYLIARGPKMAAAANEARATQLRMAGGGTGASTASELASLADLRDRGVLSEAEFQQAKAKALS